LEFRGVGFITSPVHAEQIIASGQADAVFLTSEFLREPYWSLHAVKQLKEDIKYPLQYSRAK